MNPPLKTHWPICIQNIGEQTLKYINELLRLQDAELRYTFYITHMICANKQCGHGSFGEQLLLER